MMAEQLQDAAAESPHNWFAPAIQEAVNNNVRSWIYVKATPDLAHPSAFSTHFAYQQVVSNHL